jgi:hypothetical protein
MFVSTLKPKPIGVQMPITIFFEDSFIKVEGGDLQFLRASKSR